MTKNNDITGVLLAGGQAKRMGGHDKGLLPLANQPLISHTLQKLSPQVGAILINANRHLSEYAKFGDVVQDIFPDYCGPLAGMHAGLSASQTAWTLFVPCDCPFMPDNLASLLYDAATRESSSIAVAADQYRAHPVFMLARATLAQDIKLFLDNGHRKIDKWFSQHPHSIVIFDDETAFANINTPQELAQAQERLV